VNGDIELEIGTGSGAGNYAVRVIQAAVGGEPTGSLELDVQALLGKRRLLEATVLASAVPRRSGAVDEQAVREVGCQLFNALFSGPVYGMYRASLGAVEQSGERLRVVLRLTAPELAALPWEMLFDPEQKNYLCRREPLVRHVEASYTPKPLEVHPPLRVLGLIASPRDLAALDVDAEKTNLAEALAEPVAEGLVEVVWAPEATWDGVHDKLLAEKWHVLHFVGHGAYDTQTDEGVLALVGRDGRADRVEASRLADLLDQAQPTPRLVVLNSCSSGQAGANDLFSGTAAALARGGISAVAAMQFAVSDTAAIAFARGFYTAIARGRSVDEAARSGRISMLGARGSLEWVTPVLYVRDQVTQLFTLTPARADGRETPPGQQAGARDQTPATAQATETTSPTQAVPHAEPPNSQLDHGSSVGSVKTSHGDGAAAVGQQASARLDGRQRFATLRNLSWVRAAGVAVAVLAIAIIGVITVRHLLSGSHPRGGWPYDTASTVLAQPYIVNGVAYVGNMGGYVYALDAGTGAARWQFPPAGNPAIGSVYGPLGVAGHNVYVGSDDGRIYALDDATGGVVWSRVCGAWGDGVRSSPIYVEGVVYATSRSGYVCALRAVNGARFWNPVWIGRFPPDSSSTPTPSLHLPGTSLYRISIYVGSSDGHVYALNAGSGAIRWEFPPKGTPGIGTIDTRPTLSYDGLTIYVASSGSGGHLYALAAGTGTLRWEYPKTNQPGIGTIVSQPAVAPDGSAVYVSSGSDVYAIDVSNGTSLSKWKRDPVQLSSPIGTAGPELNSTMPGSTLEIYVGSGNHVDCLNAVNGTRCWKAPPTTDSQVVSIPGVNGDNGDIFVGTQDGKVYVLTPIGAPVCAVNSRSC
jgi:outer membrane protein assembly factor BamB/CHAT domain-containing protein